MKENYLLGSDQEINAHLRSIGAKNFRLKAESDLENFCFRVIANGDIELISRIITRYPIITKHINGFFDINGYSVLHIAALNRRTEMVEFLLKLGADPNARLSSEATSALELVCITIDKRFMHETVAIINLLLTKTSHDEVNRILSFLETSPMHRIGYNVLLSLVQEYRIAQILDEMADFEDQLPDDLIDDEEIIEQKPSKKAKLGEREPQDLFEMLHAAGIYEPLFPSEGIFHDPLNCDPLVAALSIKSNFG